jgi:uncharacterized protein YndB with AHSA1/START domain
MPTPVTELPVGIEIRRVFDAPREQVWREWTEPQAFADWFGGPDCEVPLETVSMDVQPGGTWQLTMYAPPNGRRIDWQGEYVTVEAPERLELTITDRPDEPERAYLLVVLTDLGDGRTEMHFQQRDDRPPEALEPAKRGWGVFFDRVAERLG